MINGEYVGQIVSAKVIGQKGSYRLIWTQCLHCGKPKWMRINLNNEPVRSVYCASCGLHLAKKARSIAENNKDDIIRKYVIEQKSAASISREYKLTITTITSKLKGWGIDIVNRHLTQSHHPSWKGGRVKSNSGYWDIFVTKNDFFYPMVRAKTSHGTGGYVREHRIIMAKYLQRNLLSWEVVHHRNGIKDDNRLENLELLPHGKYHLTDTVSKSKIATLQKKIISLEKENQLLKGKIFSLLSHPQPLESQ